MVHAHKPAGPCPLPGFWRDGSLASSVPLRYLGCFQVLCCHQCFPSSCPSCSSCGERCTSLPVSWQRRKIQGKLLPLCLHAGCPCVPVRSPSFLHFNTLYIYIPINTQYVYIPINTHYIYIPINICYIYIPISGNKHFQEGGTAPHRGRKLLSWEAHGPNGTECFYTNSQGWAPVQEACFRAPPLPTCWQTDLLPETVCMQILRSTQMLSLSRRHPACSQGDGMSPQSCAVVCLSLMLVGKLGWGERKAPWVLWELQVG